MWYLINRHKAWQANSLVWKKDCAGVKPDELTYNLMIKGFCMICELEMAKRISVFNSKIHQTMVHYLCKGGEFDMAFRLCKDNMKGIGFIVLTPFDRLLKGLVYLKGLECWGDHEVC